MESAPSAPMLGCRAPNHGYRKVKPFGNIAPRSFAAGERSALKLVERIDVDHLVAESFEAELEPEPAAFLDGVDLDEADTMLDEAECDTYAGLARQVVEEDGDEPLPWDTQAPHIYGDVFDPEDVQWGFIVRTRF